MRNAQKSNYPIQVTIIIIHAKHVSHLMSGHRHCIIVLLPDVTITVINAIPQAAYYVLQDIIL
jgi:hypothetical protein